MPESVTDEEAAMTEPLAAGATAALCSGVKLGETVAVIGVSHVCPVVMAAARAAGIETSEIQAGECQAVYN